MYYELTFCGKVYLNLLTYIISCQKSQLTTIFTEKKNKKYLQYFLYMLFSWGKCLFFSVDFHKIELYVFCVSGNRERESLG